MFSFCFEGFRQRSSVSGVNNFQIFAWHLASTFLTNLIDLVPVWQNIYKYLHKIAEQIRILIDNYFQAQMPYDWFENQYTELRDLLFGCLVFKLSFRLESHCLDVVMLHIWFNHLLNNLLLVFSRMYHKLVSILELTWHYINTVNFNFLCYKILFKIQFWSSSFGHKNVFRSGVTQMWYLITLKSFLILKTNIFALYVVTSSWN